MSRTTWRLWMSTVVLATMSAAVWAQDTETATPPATPAASAAEEEACQKIKDLAGQKLDGASMKPTDYRKATTDRLAAVVKACEEFQKSYPKSPKTLEVLCEQAKAQYQFGRMSHSDAESEKGVALAAKIVKMDPKSDEAGEVRQVLMAYYKNAGKTEEMLAQAQALSDDFPETEAAALALRYMAEAYEGMKKDAEALAAWQKMAERFPTSPIGRRAAGVLAFRKIKGTTLDLAFTASDGRKVDAAALRGKVLIVYFWSASDASGTSNLAYIAAAESGLREQGLTAVGVCLETKEELMKKACADAKATWPQHFDGKKWDNDLVVKLGVRTIPLAILVDRKGVVRETTLLGQPLIDAARKLLEE
jgi:tetratricopeptide (TPR) repeat protein